MPKARIDELLLRRDLVEDLAEARARIMAGEVIAGEHRVDKPGLTFDVHTSIRLRGRKTHRFVSRGGLKLEGALQAFHLDVSGCIALDLGASTGGFTDCLPQSGVRRVYAVDVGYNLLDWSLRNDDRVVCLERTHAGRLTSSELPEEINLLVADLSFTSVSRILPGVMKFLSSAALLVVLVKPQFEAPRSLIGKGGLVLDPEVHRQVCNGVSRAVTELGCKVIGIEPSPIKGASGNQEFLLAAQFE